MRHHTTMTAKSYNTATFILPAPAAKPVATTKQFSAEEQEYENWKKANGLDKPLSRQEYEVVFNIYA